MSKIVLIGSDKKMASKLSQLSSEEKCDFKHYKTEEEWKKEVHQKSGNKLNLIRFPYQKSFLPLGLKHYRKLNDIFHDSIKNTLRQTDGNVRETCRILKISRSTLYRRVLEFGIDLHLIRHQTRKSILRQRKSFKKVA